MTEIKMKAVKAKIIVISFCAFELYQSKKQLYNKCRIG